MMYIVMGDRNWVGPMEEVLTAPSDRKRRVLDIGCGSGIWAIQVRILNIYIYVVSGIPFFLANLLLIFVYCLFGCQRRLPTTFLTLRSSDVTSRRSSQSAFIYTSLGLAFFLRF